jgi:integrative and conjugative element protein (TIGR02256 family)
MRTRERKAGVAWWDGQALEAATTEATCSYPLETGGVLLGWRSGKHQVVIVQIVGPGPAAEHHPRSFRPDAAWQQERISEVYRDSDRRITYLGDWHTHPNGISALSLRDVSTLRRIARHADARAPRPVMAVLGGGDTEWRLTVRQLNGAWALRPEPLQLVAFST